MVRSLLQQALRFSLASVASILCYAPLTLAQSNHEGWYQVELIVFARNNDAGQEHWPSNITLRYPNNWVELKDPATQTPSPDLTQEAFYRLPASERKLNAQAQKFERNPNFQLLFHSAWRQVIRQEKSAPSILIQGGRLFGQHHELEGSIRLSVATFLKLQTNLWYSQFDLNVGQEQTRQWPELPVQPNRLATPIAGLSLDATLELEQALAMENESLAADANATADSEAAQNYLTRQIILLQQSRDMRSNEVHYVDHPVVGVVIQVTPYSAAPAVSTP